MMQHALFTSQYMRVALVTKLIFCVQTPEVKAKRRRQELFMLGIDICFAIFLTTSFIATWLITDINFWAASAPWNIASVLILIALGFALRRI